MEDYLSDDENIIEKINNFTDEECLDEYLEEDDEEMKAFEEQQMLEIRKILHEKMLKESDEGSKLSRCTSINTLDNSQHSLSKSLNQQFSNDNSLRRMASINVFNQSNISMKENNICKIKSDSCLTDKKIKKTISLGEFNKIFEKYKKRSFNPRLPPYLKR